MEVKEVILLRITSNSEDKIIMSLEQEKKKSIDMSQIMIDILIIQQKKIMFIHLQPKNVEVIKK